MTVSHSPMVTYLHKRKPEPPRISWWSKLLVWMTILVMRVLYRKPKPMKPHACSPNC